MKIKTSNAEQKIPFFDNPKNVMWILRIFYAICILLVVADFIVHRHIYVSFEEIPAFYALYGFVACVVLVVIAKAMRKFVMRDEHYYDKREDEIEQDVPRVTVEHSADDSSHPGASESADKESHK
jgi:membrane protein YdbS with pleckstrin-like domain